MTIRAVEEAMVDGVISALETKVNQLKHEVMCVREERAVIQARVKELEWDEKRINWLGSNASLLLVDNGSPLMDDGVSFRSSLDMAIAKQALDRAQESTVNGEQENTGGQG